MFRFLHAADLHIDSPLEGLSRYEGAPVDRVRVATREATKNLVRLAIERDVKFVLLAGDIYDGDWKDYNTGLFFLDQLAELARHGIRAFVIHGNHDAESQISRSLRPPPSVTILRANHPETILIEALGVAIHGQSFDTRAVTRDLQAGYPSPVRDLFNIGMLHTAGSGRPGHAPYAPCKLEDLRSKGYDYWALGHVHAREVLSEDPWIVFPGNTQGRHARECGPKGCSLVTVDEGRVASVVHEDLDVVRWIQLDLDASDARTADDVLDAVRPALERGLDSVGDRLLLARVVIHGASPAHRSLATRLEEVTNQVRAIANELANVWVERVNVKTTASVAFDRPLTDSAVASLLESFDAVADDELAREEMTQIAEELRAKLGKVGRLVAPEGPFSPASIEEAKVAAEALVRGRLAGGDA